MNSLLLASYKNPPRNLFLEWYVPFLYLFPHYQSNVLLFGFQVAQSDTIEDAENSEDTLARLGSRAL